jgi:hypothetical protein
MLAEQSLFASDKRYIVGQVWYNSNTLLKDNFILALRRFEGLLDYVRHLLS